MNLLSITPRAARFRNSLAKLSESFNPTSSRSQVASPFSLWVLLAMTLQISQKADPGTDYDKVASETLQMTVKEVSDILRETPSEVRVAFAAWGSARYQEWLSTASEFIPAHAHIPSQAELNSWASDSTDGLIPEFPLNLSSGRADIIMANAIVSDLTWTQPFDVIDAPAELSATVQKALHQTFQGLHTLTILETGDGEKILKLTLHAQDQKRVRLFLPQQDSTLSLAELYRFMHLNYDRHKPLPEELNLETHGWGITRIVESAASQLTVTTPAWSIKTNHGLSHNPMLKEITSAAFPSEDIEAAQTAVASFRKDGFTAAAVTGFATRTAAFIPSIAPRPHHDVKLFSKFGFIVEEANLPLFVGHVQDDAFENVE